VSDVSVLNNYNATFYSFRLNGKWHSTGRGWLPLDVYKIAKMPDRRKAVCQANGGMYPGTHPEVVSPWNAELTFVIVPDQLMSHIMPMILPMGDMA
jgi:hypothetical protein